MIYTIYNDTTGEIMFSQGSSDEAFRPDQSYIEGAWSKAEYYVVNGLPTPLPHNPTTDLLKYKFNYATKVWELNQELSEFNVKTQRNQLLTAVDRINPVWYSSLTDQQKNDLAAYRQALLDVPQQAGFP